jgi:alpha-beta hydrolase superfamily lysophospholipase
VRLLFSVATSHTLESFSIRSLHAALHVKVHGAAGIPRRSLQLHGGPGTPDYLDEVAAHLGRRYRAITFDQRGTGRSRALDGSYALDRTFDDSATRLPTTSARVLHLSGAFVGAGCCPTATPGSSPRRLRSLFLSSPVPGPGRQWVAMIAEESAFIARWFSVPDLCASVPAGCAASGRFGGRLAAILRHGVEILFFNPEAPHPWTRRCGAGITGKPPRGPCGPFSKPPPAYSTAWPMP